LRQGDWQRRSVAEPNVARVEGHIIFCWPETGRIATLGMQSSISKQTVILNQKAAYGCHIQLS
jgi:hypothetical protein